MTLTQYTSRIERAWLRYQLAKTDAWKDRWQFGYLAAVSASNAVRAVSLVRDPASVRDGLAGLRQEGCVPVEAASERKPTTDVVEREAP